jgi:hypothetical protein
MVLPVLVQESKLNFLDVLSPVLIHVALGEYFESPGDVAAQVVLSECGVSFTYPAGLHSYFVLSFESTTHPSVGIAVAVAVPVQSAVVNVSILAAEATPDRTRAPAGIMFILLIIVIAFLL